MNRFLAFLAVILMGCATGSLTQRMAQVREGMSEGELTELLGTFDYTFTEGGATTSYYVIVGQDGIVRSSGRN
jgi:hypothetical protein